MQEENTANNTEIFKSAIDLHRRGCFSEAKVLYQNFLKMQPDNADAMHLLGVAMSQSGELILAKQKILSAISINNHHSYQNSLGNVYKSLNKFSEATYHYELAIKIGGGSEAYCNLANLYVDTDDLIKSEELYLKAIELDPKCGQAYCNLGGVYDLQNKIDKSILYYQKAINILSENPVLFTNLANQYSKKNEIKKAEAFYLKAIELDSDYSDARYNLGLLYKKNGNIQSATKHIARLYNNAPEDPNVINLYLRLIIEQGEYKEIGQLVNELMNFDDGVYLFAESLCLLNSCFELDLSILEPHLITCLKDRRIDHQKISRFCFEIIKKKYIGQSLEKLKIGSFRELLDNGSKKTDLSIIAVDFLNDELLLLLLRNTLVADIKIEAILKTFRLNFLNLIAVEKDRSIFYHYNDFLLALAHQCFHNEYIFCCSSDELNTVNRIIDDLNQKNKKDLISAIPEIAIIGSYIPLHEACFSEFLLEKNNFPKDFERLIKLQLLDVYYERKCISRINAYTELNNAVSIKIKQQYEKNPYPRWLSVDIPSNKISFIDYFASIFPRVRINNLMSVLGNKDNLDVLIAGCGTGKQCIQFSTLIKNVDIKAIDLSFSSLGYTQRKIDEYEINNIELLNADILEYGDCKKVYDVIECSGVLHHLEEPEKGLGVLKTLLNKSGVMKIAVYSKTGRHFLESAREEIDKRGYKYNNGGLKKIRQSIISNQSCGYATIRSINDFYSESQLRDLLFNENEHLFDIPRIVEMLDKNKLTFIGFEFSNPGILKKYQSEYPEDHNCDDLDNWFLFEKENPAIFLEMYKFWVQHKK